MSNSRTAIVPMTLNGGRVTSGFRDALFSAAGREGVSVNEFVLQAAAEKLRQMGEAVDGVFAAGDLAAGNDNAAPSHQPATHSPDK